MSYYFLTLGTLISAFAAWAIWAHTRILLFGTRAQGTIVDVDHRLRYGGGDRKKIYFHAVIQFCDADGHTHRFTYGYGSTRKPDVGRQVTVVYSDPKAARLNTFMGVWAGPLAAALLGGTLLFAGVSLLTAE